MPRALQEIAPGVLECGRTLKSRWPEQPSCVHGPMHSAGQRWSCTVRARTEYRKWVAENPGRKKEMLKEYRQRQIAQGLCKDGCGRPAFPGDKRCELHKLKTVRYVAKRYREAKVEMYAILEQELQQLRKEGL